MRGQRRSYGATRVLHTGDYWTGRIIGAVVSEKDRITAGTVMAIEADFSPNAIALILALIETGCIAVPLTSSVAAKKAEFMAIAGVEALLELDEHDEAQLTRFERPRSHELLQRLREARASRADSIFLWLNGAEQGGRPRYRRDTQ